MQSSKRDFLKYLGFHTAGPNLNSMQQQDKKESIHAVCGCGRTLVPVYGLNGTRIGLTHESIEDEEHHCEYFSSLTSKPSPVIEGESKAIKLLQKWIDIVDDEDSNGGGISRIITEARRLLEPSTVEPMEEKDLLGNGTDIPEWFNDWMKGEFNNKNGARLLKLGAKKAFRAILAHPPVIEIGETADSEDDGKDEDRLAYAYEERDEAIEKFNKLLKSSMAPLITDIFVLWLNERIGEQEILMDRENQKTEPYQAYYGAWNMLDQVKEKYLSFKASHPAPDPIVEKTEKQVRVTLRNGYIATVSPNASPELLDALTKMVDLAKAMPDAPKEQPDL